VPLKEIKAQTADSANAVKAFLILAQRGLETYDKSYHENGPALHASGLSNSKISDPTRAASRLAHLEEKMTVGVRRSWKAACDAACSCCCHRRFRARSPRLLDPLFGALHIEHTSARANTVRCSEKECATRSTFSAVIQYHFPVWLVARTFSLVVFDAFNLGSPAACLFVQRVISPLHEVFQRVRAGDLESVKALLSDRAFGPNDLHMTARWTPLHVSHF
jgi:hypothetical protein